MTDVQDLIARPKYQIISYYFSYSLDKEQTNIHRG